MNKQLIGLPCVGGKSRLVEVLSAIVEEQADKGNVTEVYDLCGGGGKIILSLNHKKFKRLGYNEYEYGVATLMAMLKERDNISIINNKVQFILDKVLTLGGAADKESIYRALFQVSKNYVVCGYDNHKDVDPITAAALTTIVGVNTSMSGRYRYCKRIPTELVENLKKKKPSNLSDIANIWYSTLSNLSELRGCRYPSARYHCINLCRLFPGPYCYHTIEFRCYPSSLHAGKLKSFIQLSALIVSHCSEISKSSYKPTVVGADESEAYKFRCWLLHLGAIGPEFSTLRHHLLGEQFGTQSRAWRRGDRTSA